MHQCCNSAWISHIIKVCSTEIKRKPLLTCWEVTDRKGTRKQWGLPAARRFLKRDVKGAQILVNRRCCPAVFIQTDLRQLLQTPWRSWKGSTGLRPHDVLQVRLQIHFLTHQDAKHLCILENKNQKHHLIITEWSPKDSHVVVTRGISIQGEQRANGNGGQVSCGQHGSYRGIWKCHHTALERRFGCVQFQVIIHIK